MSDAFRRVRFAIVWLVIFMIGRLALGATGVPYEQGTWFFSMVFLTSMSSLYFGAFSRSAWSYKWRQAVLLAIAIGLSAQLLILVATVVSYLVGAETYFNAPQALNVEDAIPLTQALVVRVGGLVVNTIIAAIVGSIGWAMGGLIPETA